MANLSDNIISVFLTKQTRVLKDTDVCLALINQGIPSNTEDIRRHVQLLSPALFRLMFNRDGTVTIHVEPKIEICQDFLGNQCKAEAKQCDRLHICRHFTGNCPTPTCRFPHDFTRGYNRKIITDNHCQNINPILLIKLLQLKTFSSGRTFNNSTSSTRGGRGRHRQVRGRGRGRGRSFASEASSRKYSLQKDDPNGQVDVSFPSSKLAEQIDMEMIEMLLNLKDIKISDKFNENENDYFRRITIQLERIDDVEKLLTTPVLNHHGTDIKFKSTNQIIDKTSFVLKISINDEQDKIDSSRIDLYVNTLIGTNHTHKTSDRSTNTEQIILIQCNDEIDFDRVQQTYKTKPQLSCKDITLIRIYECDAVEIRYNDKNKSFTDDDINIIFKSALKDIFAFNFPANDCAEIEFINANAFKQWMSMVDQIQNKFNITVTSIIDSTDEINDGTQTVLTNIDNRSITSSVYEEKPSHQTKIKLRPDWALIAGHPKFQIEYKEFIHNEFGGDIDINGDEVIYNGTFPRQTRGSSNEVILGNKTNEFMHKFKCQTLDKLNQKQIDFLRNNSATVAFSRINGSDYMVATKFQEMPELKRKLFPKTDQRYQPEPLHSTPYHKSLSNSSLKLNTIEKTPSVPLMSLITTTSIYNVASHEQISIFSIDTFEDRLRQHLQGMFNIKIIFEHKNEKSSIIIKITGQTNDVENAMQDLINILSSIRTKRFVDRTDGTWIKMKEAIEIINYYFKCNDLICICQQISPTNVNIYFFDITNPQFGIDEQRIDDIIKGHFQTAIISYNQQPMSSKLTKDLTDLEDKIRQRDDYKKNICVYNESNTVYLFGLPRLIKEYHQKFEQLKNKYLPQICKINLSERQVNYLTFVAKSDMNKLEKHYKSDGCDVSLTRLRQKSEFLAPPNMHSKIKDSLEALAQIRETSFEINEPGFEKLLAQEPERLMSLVKSKCFLEKTIDTSRIHIPLPKSRATDIDNEIKPVQITTASATSNVTSVNIGHSTITISIGDLTTQSVDAIVACSSSQYLCNAIVEKAGAPVKQEYATLKSSNQFPGVTSGGTLPCKAIIYIPWSPQSHDTDDVKSSLSTFVSFAFMYASSKGCKSIAFPAIGCGGFNFDPSIIAKYILRETQKEIIKNKIKMNISFILMANQQNVYDIFLKHLNEMNTIDPSVSVKIPKKTTNDQLTIPYDQKIIKITLISSNDNHLIKCKQDIIELARIFSVKSQLANKQDMLDWSQNTIKKFYEFCLKLRVIPTLDFDNITLELVGAKDAVHEAEKYFYELTSETFKQARIHAVSRGVIWSVELIPNSDTWEQYSFKLNGIIEDAFLKKQDHVDFQNDKEQKCRISFSKMEEYHETEVRRIRRKLVDSTLPDTWESSDQNCKRVKLQSSSTEYQNVLAQFHVTMLGKYSQIIKIERIQNERWYKQYAAHRDDFNRRYSQPDERLLFHGCPGTSADQIIRECFNRSFAGVNGVLYGCGVYFHAQASYSHQYAPTNSSGERTMFLARVLIGKTCKGDKSMKVAPTGYDTTTDGQNIFVVYHDAGAYADHLITYK